MKPTKLTILAAAVIFALACTAKAQAIFPLVKLTISGTVSCNTNSPTDNGTTTKSALTKVSITTKSLINLLNKSSAVTNTLVDVTGTNQIPTGSYFLFDLYNQNLIITNKSSFSFTLSGTDPITTIGYDYGYLLIDRQNIIGSFSQKDATGAGSESDLTGTEFSFNDANGNSLDDYGNGTLKWSFGNVLSNDVQKTTLSVSFPLPDGYGDMVNYNGAIAQNVKASGSGTGYVESGIFPFYIW